MGLLLDESPLLVSPTLARLVGLEEAIFLQQIHYWIEIKKNSPDRYQDSFKDGYWWVFNSVADWQEQMPFLGCERTIKRLISNLVDNALIVKGQYNKSSFDRTSWYRINYNRLDQLIKESDRQRQNMPDPLCKFDTMQGDKFTQTIPETSQRLQTKTSKQTIPPLPPRGEDVGSRTKNNFLFFEEREQVDQAEVISENQNQNQTHEPENSQSLKNPTPLSGPPPSRLLPRHSPDSFSQFWTQYPRHVARAAAVKAWDRIKPDSDTIAQIMHNLAKRKQNDQQWLKDNGAFIPHPATYLNQARWTDEIMAQAPVVVSGKITQHDKNLAVLEQYKAKAGVISHG